VKALVVGFGSIGERHTRNILAIDRSAIVHVYDPVGTRVGERIQALNAGNRVVHLSRVDYDEGYTFGVVCTPTSLHEPYIEEMLRHRLPLFVEKPVSDSTKNRERFLRLCRESGTITMVGCNFRFHPAIVLIKGMLDRGEVHPVSVICEFGQYLPDWRPAVDYRQVYSAQKALGGGVVLDRIHEIDYLYYLFGEIAEVHARGGHLSDLEIDTEDVCDALLVFASGVQCNLHLDYLQHYYRWYIKILDSSKTVTWDFCDRTVQVVNKGIQSVDWQIRIDHRYDINQMYLDEMAYFVDCVRKGVRTMNELDQAFRVLSYVEAIKASMQHSQAVATAVGEAERTGRDGGER